MTRICRLVRELAITTFFGAAIAVAFGMACGPPRFTAHVDPLFSPEKVERIRAAGAHWGTVAFFSVEFIDDANDADYIVIPAWVPLHTDRSKRACCGYHQRRRGLIRIDPDADDATTYKTALHEFGHAYGLEHIDNASVMRQVNPEADFTGADLAECRRVGACR